MLIGWAKKAATHMLQWWDLAQLQLTQRRPWKYINHVKNSVSSAVNVQWSVDININFCYIKKYRYRLHFNKSFQFFIYFLDSLKFFIINMMSAKSANLDLLKKATHLMLRFYIIICVNKILWHELSCRFPQPQLYKVWTKR